MPPPPLVLMDETAGRPVVLRPTGDRGAESELCKIDGRPDQVALVPALGGAYPPEAGKKLRALVAMKIDLAKTGIAAPTGVLRDPKGPAQNAPVYGFVCPRVEGVGLDSMTSPAERRRQGIDPWGDAERTASAPGLVGLSKAHETVGTRKADYNLPNIRYDHRSGKFYSIDPLSLAFEFNGWHGTAAARREMVAPELQRKLLAGTLAAERIGVEQERFALAVMLFLWFCDALPTDYAGAAADAVERKEFACVSTPPGARVSTEIQVAFYGMRPTLQALISQGLLNNPSQRPGPDKYLAELRAALPAPAAAARRPWRVSLDRVPLDRRQSAMAACVAMSVGWTALKPPRPPQPAAPAAVAVSAATTAPTADQAEKPAPRQPANPDAWMELAKKVGEK